MLMRQVESCFPRNFADFRKSFAGKMIEKRREMDEKETQIVLKAMCNEIFIRIQNSFLIFRSIVNNSFFKNRYSCLIFITFVN